MTSFPAPSRPTGASTTIAAISWRFTLVGMQGVINHSSAEVFLDWQDHNQYSGYWLEELEAEGVELERLEFEGLEAVSYLVKEFGSAFRGVVVYDPEVPDTINLATMIAGLENRVIVAPEQLDLEVFAQFDDVFDLRDLVQANGWANDVAGQTALYRWAYDTLWTDMEQRMIGLISPGPTPSQIFEDDPYWPLELASRDYYVAHCVPALYLDPMGGEQRDLLMDFAADVEPPIPILGGYAGSENGGTEYASENGNWQAAFSWPGAPVSSGNLSALAGIEVDPVTYDPVLRQDKILETLGDDPVAAIFSTDGDAFFYQLQHGFLEAGSWDGMQGQNFGWTTNPTLMDAVPVAWNHYVEDRDTVGLVAGRSGAGYIFPEMMGEAHLDAYLDYAERYMMDAGLRVVHATLDDGAWGPDLAVQFADGLAGAGHLGTMVGYGGSPGRSRLEYWGTPTPSVWPSYVLEGDNVVFVVDDLLGRRGGVEVINVDDQYLTGPWTEPDADAIDADAARIPVAFATDQSCCLAVANQTSFLPGSYQVTFRMKLPEKGPSGNVGRIYAGDQSQGWDELGGLLVSTSDFNETAVYQDFSFTFDATEPIADAEIRLDYDPGAQNDLVLDTVTVVNDEPVLPTFALIRLNWVQDVGHAPGNFAAGFEAGGGVLLNIEEFMAALNPEFMVELATPLVGPDHPLLLQAREQLGRGEHASSLASLRLALRDALQ